MPNTSSSVFGHGRPTIGPTGPVQVVTQQATPAPAPAPATPEGRFLGNKVEYKTTYDPSLLQPVKRQDNRDHLGISGDALPFVGCDVWNAYEVSAITERGIPFAGYAKIEYSCKSKYIIESKSLKLYLNSFNMTPIGKTVYTAKVFMEQKIREDLSHALETPVRVSIYFAREIAANNVSVHTDNFADLDSFIEFHKADMVCDQYNEDPRILVLTDDSSSDRVFSNSLRSSCKITFQPDWGTIFVSYTASKGVTRDSLFKYIVSMRSEHHFHEEICETVYKRLYDALNPTELTVACFYTRRGGIDINPIRSLTEHGLDEFKQYINVDEPSLKFPRQ